MQVTPNFIQWLERQMFERRLNSQELAARLGLSASSVSRILAGKQTGIQDGTVKKMCAEFRVDVEQMYRITMGHPVPAADPLEALFQFIRSHPAHHAAFFALARGLGFSPHTTLLTT